MVTERVAGQRARFPHGQRQDGHDLVAVDLFAVGGDRQAAVGVAVERDAQVGTVLQDGGPLTASTGGWSRTRR